MQTCCVRPSLYRQFGDATDARFVLITNPEFIDIFTVDPGPKYATYEIRSYAGQDFPTLINSIEEPAHVLVISPNHLIASVDPALVGRRKLGVMPVNSTPTSPITIAHFLAVLEATDPEDQKVMADRFFSGGEAAQFLRVVDEEYGTNAVFRHLQNEYEWFEQAGQMDWGAQQIVPAGEISVLPLFHGKYSATVNLAVEGQISLRGSPILHSGKPDFLRSDQQRIYDALATIQSGAVIADIADGIVTAVRPADQTCRPAAMMLESMFAVDSRYRRVWEIGFGINRALTLLDGNVGMNEVYGGDNGVIHWGLGLTPFTQYHLDIMCPGTRVLTDSGEVLVGGASTDTRTGGRHLRRVDSIGCPCLTGEGVIKAED